MSAKPLLRTVVCGSGFARVFVAALRDSNSGMQLAGILARGSERSKRVAAAAEVPLYQHVDQLPDDIRVACVVVGGALNGGTGCELARKLIGRGIHVVQEHPLHHDELAACLRDARTHNLVYELDTLHVHVEPVKRFIELTRALAARQKLLFIDAAGGFPTSFAMLDIITRAIGRVHPWGFAAPIDVSALRSVTEIPASFTSVAGALGGIPITLRLQNQLAPTDPDNHAHFFFRITLGTEGGTLSLADSYGPVLWSPRAHLPRDARDLASISSSPSPHLDLPTTTTLVEANASYRELVRVLWPRALGAMLRDVADGIHAGRTSSTSGQHYLSLCRVWQELQRVVGSVELIDPLTPQILGVDDWVPRGQP